MRPWEILPLPHPSEFDPGKEDPKYFYDNFVHPMIPDMIRMMSNGIHINQNEVENLRKVIDDVLITVEKTLAKNSLMKKFQEQQYPKKFKEYKEQVTASCRTIDHYLKEYDHKNATHRTYAVNEKILLMDDKFKTKPKWSVKDLKDFNLYLEDHYMQGIIDKTISKDSSIIKMAMHRLARDKMNIWNKVRTDKVKAATFEDLVPPFNPGSSKQKQEFFDYIGKEALAFSKDTGLPSWGREQIEQLLKEESDPIIKEVLQMFVDHSFSAIIRNNFLEAFDSFTIDGVLYGGVKLFGTKTFRPTGNSPNFLQLPSTGSIYAKPLKKCLVAPPGYKVWTIDYAALEDRVIANLSKDENKIAVFTEGLDGHSLAATYYYPLQMEKFIGKYTNNKEASKLFKKLTKTDPAAKALRQDGKGNTFKLAYGGYPDISKGGVITQEIFDNYHNKMYPGISTMRDQAIGIAKHNGYLHMGLGCRIYADDIERDSRTLFNSLSQFWSILTLISINELHHYMDKENKHEEIKITATIYDAIYGIVRDDPASIKWLNDTVCPIMEKDFMDNQIVHNEANLEIGDSWASLTELDHGLTESQIQEVLNEKDVE